MQEEQNSRQNKNIPIEISSRFLQTWIDKNALCCLAKHYSVASPAVIQWQTSSKESVWSNKTLSSLSSDMRSWAAFSMLTTLDFLFVRYIKAIFGIQWGDWLKLMVDWAMSNEGKWVDHRYVASSVAVWQAQLIISAPCWISKYLDLAVFLKWPAVIFLDSATGSADALLLDRRALSIKRVIWIFGDQLYFSSVPLSWYFLFLDRQSTLYQHQKSYVDIWWPVTLTNSAIVQQLCAPCPMTCAFLLLTPLCPDLCFCFWPALPCPDLSFSKDVIVHIFSLSIIDLDSQNWWHTHTRPVP